MPVCVMGWPLLLEKLFADAAMNPTNGYIQLHFTNFARTLNHCRGVDNQAPFFLLESLLEQ